jgi:hypothetical protein
MPSRCARSFTCAADSSPHTYTTGPVAQSCAAIWSKSVDFPAPGGPPIKVTLPGTMPPPSTASNSPIPLRMRAIFAPSIARNSTGDKAALRALATLLAARAGTAKGRSSNEFHASHCGQRPSQRADSKPQALQKKTERVFAIEPMFAAGWNATL